MIDRLDSFLDGGVSKLKFDFDNLIEENS